jgi:hypothetical protein
MVVEHPCEYITQLFMALKRNDNNDRFLKIETKYEDIFMYKFVYFVIFRFTHCRRCIGEGREKKQISNFYACLFF